MFEDVIGFILNNMKPGYDMNNIELEEIELEDLEFTSLIPLKIEVNDRWGHNDSIPSSLVSQKKFKIHSYTNMVFDNGAEKRFKIETGISTSIMFRDFDLVFRSPLDVVEDDGYSRNKITLRRKSLMKMFMYYTFSMVASEFDNLYELVNEFVKNPMFVSKVKYDNRKMNSVSGFKTYITLIRKFEPSDKLIKVNYAKAKAQLLKLRKKGEENV